MMKLVEELLHLAPQMTEWRHTLHRHPELAFAEQRTAELVASQLRAAGLQPVEGIGKTGVVAVIQGSEPGPSIALRADMDALPLNDESGKPYASSTQGCSHSCGHDGHTAALIGTAHYLASHPPVKGSVVLIFQPAEENGLGARAMISDGLLERFPFDEVYAFHNMPLLAPGTAGVRTGSTLNGFIIWEVEITGVGGHGAAFFKAVDPIQAAVRLTSEISSLVGRYLNPADSALITTCKLQAGSNHNIIPEKAVLGGTLRALDKQVQARLYQLLEQACAGIAALTGCRIECRRLAEVPPCVNAASAADTAAQACATVLGGDDKVLRDAGPFPFTDDFSFLLEAAPGAYLFLGQESAMCHNPAYDFDDRLLPVASSIFVNIVEQRLGLQAFTQVHRVAPPST